MVKPCPDCQTGMLQIDDFDNPMANWVCPECAPDFILSNVTTYSNVEDPTPTR